ncbi:MAG: 4-alpha-glucanotransferase [Elusimicrobia bacterium]|nr:4-alpha-glucanotransferase [Elusimicrobiota bacterium]
MRKSKSSGLLLHITALPSDYGIGDLGKAAYRFVDFLKKSRQKFWQVLPVNETFSGSPYNCISSFAGNTLLINTDALLKRKLLKKKISAPGWLKDSERVNFKKVYKFKEAIFKKAFKNFKPDRSFRVFLKENSFWLDDYSDFVVLKKRFKKIWINWPVKFRDRDEIAIKEFRERFSDEILFQKFKQWLFYSQWFSLKDYANKRGIKIIGDIPIFLSFDSADVWAHRKLFLLNKKGLPLFVSGVPPDYFSRTGQRWGNPIYNWKEMRKSNFLWWQMRFRHCLKLYDMIRIDHFRGFCAYWRIPAKNKTALAGKWIKAPGIELFKTLKKKLGSLPVIAEDLGYIPPTVRNFRKKLGFPGMKVLHFAFSKNRKNIHLPDNFDKNSVVYTGTHDNDTTAGWWRTLPKRQKERVKKYLAENKIEFSEKQINWNLIELAMKSRAFLSIFPVQDILGLSSKARFNRPGSGRGNWRWKLKDFSLLFKQAQRLKELTQKYCRNA